MNMTIYALMKAGVPLMGLCVGLTMAYSNASADLVKRVSRSYHGGESFGSSWQPVLNQYLSRKDKNRLDGRYIAFVSDAPNIVREDSNGWEDVFVYDQQKNTVERVSVDSKGKQGSEGSSHPSINGDGRYVAFQSWSKLVASDTNKIEDIYVRDRVKNTTERVSVSSSGRQARFSQNQTSKNTHGSHSPSISDDGRFVAFTSAADNLVKNDTNKVEDIFVRDRRTKKTIRVSVGPKGQQANKASDAPQISNDGRFVAFYSQATNLVAKDNNNAGDIFVHDIQQGTTIRVSVNEKKEAFAEGTQTISDISANGRLVTFVTADTSVDKSAGIVYLYDAKTGTSSRVSRGNFGQTPNGGSISPSMSPDGKFIVFGSYASNLVGSDTNGILDTFLYNHQTRAITRLSKDNLGNEVFDESLVIDYFYHTSISANGNQVAFQSGASTLSPGDLNNRVDVFLSDINNSITTDSTIAIMGR